MRISPLQNTFSWAVLLKSRLIRQLLLCQRQICTDNMKSFNYSESSYDRFGCILGSAPLSSVSHTFQGSCQYDVRWLPWLLIKVSAPRLHHSPLSVRPCPSNKITLWSRCIYHICKSKPLNILFFCPFCEETTKKQVAYQTQPVSRGSFQQTQAWS